MTKALPLTRNQVKALIEGTRKTGYLPVIQIGEVLIRLVPQEHAIPPQPNSLDDPETFESFDQYLAWRAKENAR